MTHRNLLLEFGGPPIKQNSAGLIDRFLGIVHIWDHLECSNRKNKATFTFTKFWYHEVKMSLFFNWRPFEGRNQPLLSITADKRQISTLKWRHIEKIGPLFYCNFLSFWSESAVIFLIRALQVVPDCQDAQEPVYEASRVLFNWRTAQFKEDTPMGYSYRP